MKFKAIKVINGSLKVTLDRDQQGTSFAEVRIFDQETRTYKSIDVYAVIEDKQTPKRSGDWGVEIYQGPNYMAEAWTSKNERSYSRHYPLAKGLPEKYLDVVIWLTYRLPYRLIIGKKFK